MKEKDMNIKSVYIGIFGTFILLFSLSHETRAEEQHEQSAYIGALGGVNIPASGGADLTPALGITAGTKIGPIFGVGVYGTYTGQTSSGNLLGLPSGTSTVNYNIAGEFNVFLNNFHIGMDIGLGISSWSGNISKITSSSTTNYLILGPEAGFDVFLGSHLSLGGEVHALFNTQNSNVQNVQTLASIKFWM